MDQEKYQEGVIARAQALEIKLDKALIKKTQLAFPKAGYQSDTCGVGGTGEVVYDFRRL